MKPNIERLTRLASTITSISVGIFLAGANLGWWVVPSWVPITMLAVLISTTVVAGWLWIKVLAAWVKERRKATQSKITELDKAKSRIVYVPLPEAGRSLYTDLREYDNQHAHIREAEGFRNKTDGVLVFFANIIAAHADVFGKRPPSTELEKLSQSELSRGRFTNGGSGFKYHGKNDLVYVDLAVNSNNIPRILNELKLQKTRS